MREGERPGPQPQVWSGTLNLLLLEELVRVQGLVEEAALHRRRRDSRGAGAEAVGAGRIAGKASEMADGS